MRTKQANSRTEIKKKKRREVECFRGDLERSLGQCILSSPGNRPTFNAIKHKQILRGESMEKVERAKRLFYLHKTSSPAMSGSLLFAMTDFGIRAHRAFDSWKNCFKFVA